MAPTSVPSPAPGSERLLQRRYRELIRKHLSHILDRLFAEFSGLHFHIAWAPASPNACNTETLPTGCSVCCKLSGSSLHQECLTCGPRHLAATLESERGHRFTCRLGVRNCWFPIRIRSATLGIAYIQALERCPHTLPGRKLSVRAGHAQSHGSGAILLSRLKFARAARLLRHVVQHVQTACLSDLRKADLNSAARAIITLEREQARLHERFQRCLTTALPVPRSSGPESRPEQIVHSLLEHVESDYAKPITLQRFARDLGMNGAYLSALFSRAVGIPFKPYLTELRLQKAKELLGDSTKTASQVAYAVGYSSEDRFRFAFKKATGLSPKVWRETMQTTPPQHSI